MNRMLKSLGFALVALCAFAAVPATGASAATRFTSENVHTELEGSQIGIEKYKTNAGTAECNEATYTGTSAATETTEQSISPAYSECKAFGFINSTVDMNGCTYNFTAAGTNTLHIACPGSNMITKTAFNCEITIP